MQIVEGKALVTSLRAAVDSARERFWVASPYIGSWQGNVRRVIGTRWQQGLKDVRLLTDVAAKGFRLNTMTQFFRRGTVRTLLGLHAKLYVADEFVLVTSANLTGTAFSKRHEVGVVLTGQCAHSAICIFQTWWDQALPVIEEGLTEPLKQTKEPGEPGGLHLPILTELPSDAKDKPLPSDSFGDYDFFLTCYSDLAKTYRGVQRIWKKAPIYFEIDGFLNYLYHDAPGRPTKPYDVRAPRNLAATKRRHEIEKYAALFAAAYKRGDISNDSAQSRSDNAKAVRQLLRRNLKSGLTRAEIEMLLYQLNSMNSYPINVARALNTENNGLGELREMLRDLIQESIPLQRRMADCSRRVVGVGRSSIQELVGFYYGGKYPIRNKNTNCGLRFFGFDVRAR